MSLVIVTGLSGAGKTNAIRFLEDIGFFVVDNMPPTFVTRFAELCLASGGKLSKAAIVCDSRVGNFFSGLTEALSELKENQIEHEILFLEADDNTLIRRYKETRRKHPLQDNITLQQAIAEDRKMLSGIRGLADRIIDTTDSSGKELISELRSMFLTDSEKIETNINVVSFGFKYGLPLDADLVFDVRFLPNPYYIPELKDHNGTESCVADYVMSFKESQEFYKKLFDMINFMIPLFAEDGRPEIVIAIGCTGGQHRSVTIAQKLYKELSKKHNAVVRHRDYQKSLE